ncbi:DUF58 domain-containing protein [Thermoplasma sp.]|uniref:DUF58 domain-containing protein n=1 Tax=Thermoplasma sp. TaxID=1973142 RepID=UPI001276986D|nr:DUF58 domain-containing protein [Thermoplasma sp.]KAA8923160.1 MAG: DUF58 domain-containing protein [Thermoplasma sp.]
MIRKAGYLILSASIYNIFESILLGYKYYIIFSIILFFVFSSDILIFNLTTARKVRNVEVEISAENEKARKFSPKEFTIAFLNQNNSPLSFHYYVYSSDTFRMAGDFEGFLALKPFERVVRKFIVTPNTIGRYRLGPVSVYTEDGMRFAIERAEVSRTIDLKVAPALSEIMAARSERISNMLYYTGIHYNKKAGQGYDFLTLREYVPGDEIRYVAWSMIGRTKGDDLYVKQMEEERIMDVIFLIDYGNGMNQGHDGKRMFDSIMADVIKTSYKIRKNQDGVGYFISSSDINIFIPPERTATPIENLQKVISDIRPSGSFSMRYSIDFLRRKIKKTTMIFVISSFEYGEDPVSVRDIIGSYKAMFFVVNPYDFVVTGEENRTLRATLFHKQRSIVDRKREILRSLGFRTEIVGSRDAYRKLVSSYLYAKMNNIGE